MAVANMKNVSDATNPNSWMYWANVHGMTTSAPNALIGVWDKCDHGNYFLAWHRMYLAFFERVIAHISGKRNFAMPYWDWYSSELLPEHFTEPSGPGNPLWREKRQYTVKFPVSTTVLSSPGTREYNDFNQFSFGDPHSNIHLNFSGEMSTPATAARDPVFWPHHAAMDRLWEIWAADQTHAGPDRNSLWAQNKFSFLLTRDGREIKVADMLTTADLGYKYDDFSIASKVVRAPLRPPGKPEVAEAVHIPEGLAASDAKVALSQYRSLRLGGDAKSVEFPLPNNAGGTLEAVGAETSKRQLWIVLDGVVLTERGRRERVLYDIYINLPRSTPQESPPSAGSYKVGQINSFGLAQDHASGQHQQHKIEIRLDKYIPSLRVSGAWSPDRLNINFIPGSTEASGPPMITIQTLRVELR
ncbi:tyrosinase family protein [Caballeronia sp. ATUFL_F2_KS9A]|uniref:tyrosinase family protein n=1 Tax=Caballeronia sp. ATUFL_F2_KS9A TaxID=2921777 RepID=UPI002027EA4B|nr:tyrosinase family protein [Caballeronia sp. ATUFL_F2_KS9A]